MEVPYELLMQIAQAQKVLTDGIGVHQMWYGKHVKEPQNEEYKQKMMEAEQDIKRSGSAQKVLTDRLRALIAEHKRRTNNDCTGQMRTELLKMIQKIKSQSLKEKKVPVTKTEENQQSEDNAVENGEIPFSKLSIDDDQPNKERSSSVETISGEDEVIEVSDENSCEKNDNSDIAQLTEKVDFMCNIGLITKARLKEVKRKKSERKRRSTANSHFLYGNWESKSRRKRKSEEKDPPQTRQATARANGSSSPPIKPAAAAATPRPKSTSPPTRSVAQSLVPVQKSTARPNILRNVSESKVFANKSKLENGTTPMSQVQIQTARATQLGSKTVHIPGLPSGLTIERIDNEPSNCVACRNPGNLNSCDVCSLNYHMSCHPVTPTPTNLCPNCWAKNNEEENPDFKEEEFAPATVTSGTGRKTGENAEVNQENNGLHSYNAKKRRYLPPGLTIRSLPPSSVLIPLPQNALAGTSSQPDFIGSSATTTVHLEQQPDGSNVTTTTYSPIVFNQLVQSNIAYIQSETQVSYKCQLLINNQSEKQSYLVLKKLADPVGCHNGGGQAVDVSAAIPTVINYQLPSTSGSNNRGQPAAFAIAQPSVFVNNRTIEPKHGPIRNRKKQTNRAVPALNRIVDTQRLSIPNNCRLLEQTAINGRKPKGSQQRIKGLNQVKSPRATEVLLPSYDVAKSDDQLTIAKPSTSAEESTTSNRRGRPLHSLHMFFGIDERNAGEPSEHRGLVIRGGGRRASQIVDHKKFRNSNCQLDPNERPDEPAVLQRTSISKFFGNVKLEETHLPAPSRAKVVCNDDDDNDVIIERESMESNGTTNQPRIRQNIVYANENSVQEPKGKWVNKGKLKLVKCPPGVVFSRNDDYATIEPKYSETYMVCNIDDKNGVTITNETRHEISVPDDKADDTESKDLQSGSSESDTPEQAMEDQHEYSQQNFSGEYEEHLEITSVSPADMQVLEQYESEMVDSDRDSTANS